MKEILRYNKRYAIDETNQKIHPDYNKFVTRINSDAILINKNSPETYISIEERCLTKIEISYEKIDDETLYFVTINIEKQGQYLESKIEKILLSEGFRMFEEPVV